MKEIDLQSMTLLPDLEWNPRSIYRSIIQQEETETGIKSEKDLNATVDECLGNDRVREVLDKNLTTLCRLVEGNFLIFVFMNKRLYFDLSTSVQVFLTQ